MFLFSVGSEITYNFVAFDSTINSVTLSFLLNLVVLSKLLFQPFPSFALRISALTIDVSLALPWTNLFQCIKNERTGPLKTLQKIPLVQLTRCKKRIDVPEVAFLIFVGNVLLYHIFISPNLFVRDWIDHVCIFKIIQFVFFILLINSNR